MPRDLINYAQTGQGYRPDMQQLPEVAIYLPDMPVWVLRTVGQGTKKRTYRYKGIVIRPLYVKVKVRFWDNTGCMHIISIAPERLEMRAE